ncbi:methyl-accepting chemotaxis protein [Desulfosporosinus orientis DSM 765]|uniref:Methyl-accepting chemotaxis protein n=1 Tax=Desulfosporosinus orientis (strain ATCC 19365 / DSM 765 / NCIMB 8382 / VKM B-1628 / Singapore I) TaxID=768706 RepID=G7WE47_DESOD|nr:methyl-accepting chemotaxis protein [Desulfosporosinus orientis]AET69445.1 methyl-accepting chemotaxis protein [Desulfosporosinus orientis DSM 765]
MVFRDMKLRNRIMISTGFVVIVSFVIVIFLVGIKAQTMAKTSAYEIADRTAEQYASQVTNELNSSMDATRTLASTFKGMKETNMVQRSSMNAMIVDVLKDNPKFMATWTLWEPNALDGNDSAYVNQPGHDATGRFIPYWNRGNGEITLEALVDYDKPGAGDYYLVPKETKEETLVEPYDYPINGKTVLITSVVVPIINAQGTFLGVAGTDLELSAIQKMIAGIKPLKTGSASLFSNKGVYVADPDSEKIGQDVGDVAVKEAISKGSVYSVTDDNYYRVYAPIKVGNSTTPWSIMISVPMSTVLEQADSIRNFSILVALVAILAIGIVLFIVSSNITKPIVHTSKVLKDISEGEGDLTQRLENQGKNEVGELASYFNRFIENIHSIVKEVSVTAENLGSTSEELSAAAEEATASSEQVANTLGQLADGASEQAIAVGNTSKVIEQLSVNAQQVAENAENVNQSSSKAAQAAEVGALQAENAVQKIQQIQEVSEQTAEVVNQLGQKSTEIGQIVDVIRGIAEQTNLLALNAAIEAARAGEQGRGFAVVAEEVRKLAEQSSSSTAQIATLIGNIQRETERAVGVMEKGKVEVAAGVQAVNQAGESFQTIVGEVNSVVAQIKQVTDAAQHMAAGISEAVHSVEGIGVIAEQSAASTQEVSAASEEQSATMSTVSQSAENLADLGRNLGRLVGEFKL